MTNMSYCRFENTSRDLDDCADALRELFDGPSIDDSSDACLSERELSAAKSLLSAALCMLTRVADESRVSLCELTHETIERALDRANYRWFDGDGG